VFSIKYTDSITNIKFDYPFLRNTINGAICVIVNIDKKIVWNYN